MCLLLAAPNGMGDWSEDFFDNATAANPHGFGMAWVENGRVWYAKGMARDEALAQIKKCAKLPTICHWRYATHGSAGASNCHPFVWGEYVAAHNGIIDIAPIGDMTDSETYLQTLPKKYAELDITSIESRIGRGNKMAFLSSAGLMIANESAGQWHEGVWYSNQSYASSNYGFAVPDIYDDLGGDPWHMLFDFFEEVAEVIPAETRKKWERKIYY